MHLCCGSPRLSDSTAVSSQICLRSQAVKAMHFDDDGSKGQLESADARKDRLAQEAELAQAIQDNPDGDDDL